MRSVLVGVSLAMVAVLALTACAADPTPTPAFYTHLSVGREGQTIVMGEIRNAGYAAMRSMIGWQGILQVRDEAGREVACATAAELTAAMLPGDSDFPLVWSGPLAAGRYQVIWGAPGHGGILVELQVVEQGGQVALERGTTTRLAAGAVPDAESCAAGGGETTQREGGPELP